MRDKTDSNLPIRANGWWPPSIGLPLVAVLSEHLA